MIWRQAHWLHGLGVVLVLAWSTRFVLIYTPTNSLPKGWYLRAWPSREIAVGDIVVVATPPHLKALLPPGLPHAGLLKQVAGVGGMQVCWTPAEMRVHTGAGWSRYPKHPAIARRDEPDHCEILTEAYVVLVGSHPRSLDSRYLGTMLKDYIQFRVWALWTWEGS
jgi:type IV secretory pathway protease TraF